jgi:uncharacterized iron-regulated membrane protein
MDIKVLWAKLLAWAGVKTAWGLLAKMLAFFGISIAVDEAVDWITGDETPDSVVQEKVEKVVDGYLKQLADKIERRDY